MCSSRDNVQHLRTNVQNSRTYQPQSEQFPLCSSYDHYETSITTPTNAAHPPSSHVPNSNGHYYYHHRGAAQSSPVFNSVISNQSQNLYNGMFGPQSNFSNQSAFGFNSYGIVDPPAWMFENRVSSSGGTQTEQTSKNLYNEKNLSCHSQGTSHSCCGQRVLESTGLCSPLSADPFKILAKDLLGSKNIGNVDTHSWFCSPGLGTPLSQQTHTDHNSVKCSEQFPACALPQINPTSNDHSDIKFSVSSNISNSYFSTVSQISSSKAVPCLSESNRLNPEITKEQSSKFYSSQKVQQQSANTPENLLPKSSQEDQSSIFSTPLEDVLCSNAPFPIHFNSDVTQCKPHSSLLQNKDNCHSHTNFEDVGKTFPTPHDQVSLSQQSYHIQKYSTEPLAHCDTMNSCLPPETKVGSECSLSGVNISSCCQLQDPLNAFGSHHNTLRSHTNCFQNSSLDVCLGTTAPPCEDVEDDKENSNQGSSTAGGESDIIVEETGGEEEGDEEVTRNERAALATSATGRCFVCDIAENSHMSSVCFVQMNSNSPVSSTSNCPIVKKLEEVLSCDVLNHVVAHEVSICKRCLNLVDAVDCLEMKLDAVKQDIRQLYSNKTDGSLLNIANHWIRNSREKIIESDDSQNSENESRENNRTIVDVTSDFTNEATELKTTKTQCLAEEQETVSEDKLGESNLSIVSETKETKTDKTSLCVAQYDSPSEAPKQQEEISCKKVRCVLCDKFFCSKEYLNRHKQQHTKQFSFYCDRCGRGFSMRRRLENHLLVHRGEFRYQCEVCGHGFIQKHSLDDHLRRHQGRFRLTCAQCGRGFLHRSSFRIHLRTHTGERPFICEHCGHSFSSVSNLRTHSRICKGDMPYSCDKCGKKFAMKAHLHAHINAHDGNFRFKCNICSRGFMKEFDYKVHLRTHSGEKPHKCTVCGKCYTSIGNLNQHIKKHSKDKPYNCSLCNKGFLRKTMLVAHINEHTGDRPFTCKHCDKSFTSARNLHTHEKNHTADGKKFVTCSVCGKSISHNLKVHMRTHTGQKPYTCQHCQMAFTVKSSLDKHIRTKHKAESETKSAKK